MPHAVSDAPHEACGVMGVYAPGEEAARLAFFGLFALQHRGQESAGIAVSDGRALTVHKDMGLVSQVFTETTLGKLGGCLAIGHTRYSTTGSSRLCNAQPVLVATPLGSIAVAHNGNLVNASSLRRALEQAGVRLEGSSDSEVIARLIALEANQAANLTEATLRVMPRLHGAYSIVMLTPTQLIAFRDPWGFRPLCLGALNGNDYVVASETCALNVIGARFMREVEPGELLAIGPAGLQSALAGEPPDLPRPRPAMCIFEFIYFARPDSHIYGKTMHMARRRMGQQLATEYPVVADVVIPVPDTSWPAAIGYAETSRIPFGEGLIKNRYIGRTFIQPDQRMRELGVRMKLTPLRETVSGKRVVLIEDSIVRGTTTKYTLRMLRDAGAGEIHMRISSPPYRFPCYYGIDTPDPAKLLAAHNSVDEIRRYIGADTLGYLSIPGLMRAVNLPKNKFCLACFNGQYPVPVPREAARCKYALEDPGPTPDTT